MTLFVKCTDNTMQRRVLDLGKEYEVLKVNKRDGYYELSGLGEFSMARFEVVARLETQSTSKV